MDERDRTLSHHPRDPDRPGRRGGDVRGPCARARAVARRHLHPARELVVLLPPRYLAAPERGALAHPVSARPPMSVLAATLAALAMLFLLVGRPATATGQSTGAGPMIRVAVAERVPAVEVQGASLEIWELEACPACRALARPDIARALAGRSDVVRVTPSGTGLEIAGRRAGALRLPGNGLRWGGREYGGMIDLLRSADGIAVVNEVALEDYVAGVVRAEAGERWPREALRAQAVAVRTYAAHHRLLNAAKPYHLVASTAHQQFAGRVPATSPVWTAVTETAGQILLWEGEPFPAFYHTDSGGFTEDPRTVFAARNMPALRPVRCEFSAGSPHYY